MIVGSLFAGIGGFDEGLRQAGMESSWQVEKEPFCLKVLKTRFPNAQRAARYSYLPWVDLICAGVPCQDWSVAGKRKGLRGKRSVLVYQFARILHELRPTWFLFENVPGLLSSNDGRDFAEVLRLFMVKCGYGIQWRVLDSQFFGVAQRRRRLFIVGRFGKPCPAEILFEPEGGRGDFAQGEEARPDVARAVDDGIASFDWANSPSQTMRIDERTTDALRSSPNGYPAVAYKRRGITGNAPGRRREDDFNLAVGPRAPTPTFALSGQHRFDATVEHFVVGSLQSHAKRHGHAMSTQQAAENGQIVETAYCLREDPGGIGQGHNTTYAITENMRNRSQGPAEYILGRDPEHQERTSEFDGDPRGDDEHNGHAHYVSAPPDANRVRSAPGISEGVDEIAQYYEGWLPKGQDSARYRALGNAVTVNVIRWLGQRILKYGNV